MPKHALISPSSVYRTLLCPPSAKLNAAAPDQSSSLAQEGTDAHELCAYLVEKALGHDVRDPTEDLTFYNAEMQNCAEDYCSYVLEQIEAAKEYCADPEVMIEQHIDFSRWVKDGFGTADCIIASDGILHVIDFKYGVGVPVSASTTEFGGNPQLMCYALGALSLYEGIYDFDTVKMHIFQPRLSNVSTYEMSTEDLLKWANETLAPIAEIASKGEGEFAAGDHCKFCKIKATCRKRAEYNLELAKYDFQMPEELTDYEIDAILMKVDQMISWAGDVKEYALGQALQGTEYNNFKVVEGRSSRKYSDEDQVAKIVRAAGFDPYDLSVKGVTAMTKLLGKKKFDELLGSLTFKPPGKPTLVSKADKRPAMKNTAQNDFKENIYD